jgi:hypothetical protein
LTWSGVNPRCSAVVLSWSGSGYCPYISSYKFNYILELHTREPLASTLAVAVLARTAEEAVAVLARTAGEAVGWARTIVRQELVDLAGV